MADELASIYRDTLKTYHRKCLQDYAGINNTYGVGMETALFMVMDVAYATTKNDSSVYKLLVTDPSLDPNVTFTCNFFTHDHDKDMLPSIKPGDTVLMKDAWIRQFGNKPQIVKNDRTHVVLFDGEGTWKYTSQKFPKENEDLEICGTFLNWKLAKFPHSNGSSDEPHPMTSSRRPFLTTDQILEDEAKYFNYVGMVVGFFEEKDKKREIKLTDFTVNPRPFVRTDDTLDDGTIGDITSNISLLCTLYEEHAKCDHFKFGDYIFLDNCTRNLKNPLQLEIRVSYAPGDRQHVFKLDAKDHRNLSRLQPLLSRRKVYNASLHRSASQVEKTVNNPMRTRTPGHQEFVSIKQLLEKEEPGVEFIRATIENQKPSDLTTWLKNYCSHCRTSVPTISDGMYACCSTCGSLMSPVYRAKFKVKDESGSELVVLVIDEDADKLFKDIPAHRLKSDPSLIGLLEKYLRYTEEINNEPKPKFGLGIKKYYANSSIKDGWMYRIVKTEFVIEDDSK